MRDHFGPGKPGVEAGGNRGRQACVRDYGDADGQRCSAQKEVYLRPRG